MTRFTGNEIQHRYISRPHSSITIKAQINTNPPLFPRCLIKCMPSSMHRVNPTYKYWSSLCGGERERKSCRKNDASSHPGDHWGLGRRHFMKPKALFDPMEGLESVYAQDIYGLMAKNSALLLTNSFVHEFESLVKFNMLVTKLLRSIFHRSIRDHDRAITKPKSLKRNRDNTGSHVLIVHHPQYDSENGSLKLIYYENQWKTKKPRTEKERVDSSNISFQHSTSLIAQMKEIIYTPSMEIMGQMHFM
ncbi:hypothetical protein HID58_034643 [Brassica napus]|uniref:Uncharacterized protein n=1 Tax=Brassica napus TaxID=3708 RepID=A0ABQ8C2M9_BRANA|nr:hypothetical protein HID58_034643 [Brassica napus]